MAEKYQCLHQSAHSGWSVGQMAGKCILLATSVWMGSYPLSSVTKSSISSASTRCSSELRHSTQCAASCTCSVGCCMEWYHAEKCGVTVLCHRHCQFKLHFELVVQETSVPILPRPSVIYSVIYGKRHASRPPCGPLSFFLGRGPWGITNSIG
jgi:hypothetical protein